MPNKIFVNYRREDVRAEAARVRDRLAGTFGAASVFMDVDNLLAGQRFDKQLERALAQTDVLIAIIGPHWTEILEERRKKGDRDYVREEISSALSRGIVVIPVVVEWTALPRADTLPDDIRDLILHHKHDVSHERFGRDVDALIAAIKAVRRSARSERRAFKSPRLLIAASIIVVVTGILGLVFYQQFYSQNAGVSATTTQRRPPTAREATTATTSQGGRSAAQSPTPTTSQPPPPEPARGAAHRNWDEYIQAETPISPQPSPSEQQSQRRQILRDTQRKIFEIEQNAPTSRPSTQNDSYRKWDNYIRE
jgi:TIR domain